LAAATGTIDKVLIDISHVYVLITAQISLGPIRRSWYANYRPVCIILVNFIGYRKFSVVLSTLHNNLQWSSVCSNCMVSRNFHKLKAGLACFLLAI